MDVTQAIKEVIEYSGLFDFPNLYSFVHTAVKKRRYGVDEDKYSEKKSNNIREVLVKWVCRRKITDYLKSELKIEMTISNLADVEVEIDGQKRIMNKGKAEIEIEGYLVLDPENKWEDSGMGRVFKNIYESFKGVDENHAKAYIIHDVKTIKEDIKAYLEMLGIL